MWRYIHARTVARVRPRLRWPVPDDGPRVDRFIRQTIESRASFSVLQVGAYDGISNDPLVDLIRSYSHIRAVLLEPQPGPHAALEALWRDRPQVVPLQYAFADGCGERPLYVLADACKSLHPFPDQIASFSRSRVEEACSRYVWRPSKDLVTSIFVRTVDWRTLMEQYGPFDFVTIDVEGYDSAVLLVLAPVAVDRSPSPPRSWAKPRVSRPGTLAR